MKFVGADLRLTLKGLKALDMIAQGKRSAALGYLSTNISRPCKGKEDPARASAGDSRSSTFKVQSSRFKVLAWRLNLEP
jgi:hypothetical protein